MHTSLKHTIDRIANTCYILDEHFIKLSKNSSKWSTFANVIGLQFLSSTVEITVLDKWPQGHRWGFQNFFKNIIVLWKGEFSWNS